MIFSDDWAEIDFVVVGEEGTKVDCCCVEPDSRDAVISAVVVIETISMTDFETTSATLVDTVSRSPTTRSSRQHSQ